MKYELRIMNLKKRQVSGIFAGGQAQLRWDLRNWPSEQIVSRKILLATVTFLASCFLLLASVPQALAQEFSAGINPPIIFIEAEPPARVTAPITLENQSDNAITYGIFLRPFKANSEMNGMPNYDPSLGSEYEDFFKNVQIQFEDEDITEISLGPKQSKDMTLNIRVEAGQPPLDRYFTVVFLAEEENPDPKTSFAGAQGGIGTNVLLTVGPKSESKGRIANFKAPLFISHGPVPFELELANHNDFYVVSNGNVVIKNMFGQFVGNLEFGPLSILANSNREITNNDSSEPRMYWNEKYPIGIYKAQAKVALSEQGPLLTDEITFIAFPIEIAFILILVILIFIWLIRRARRKTFEND